MRCHTTSATWPVPVAQALFPDWDDVARGDVALLRLASGTRLDDRQLSELVGKLCIKVPAFHLWWDSHHVGQSAHGRQRLRHETLALPADEDQQILLYTADPGTSSAEPLRLLASWTTPATVMRMLREHDESVAAAASA